MPVVTRKLTALLLLASVLLSACSSPVTQQSYERIETGMTREQVQRILGDPDDLNSIELGELSGSTARWMGGEHTITVTFANGKVALKRFSGPPETNRD